jgi:hypothetical protein
LRHSQGQNVHPNLLRTIWLSSVERCTLTPSQIHLSFINVACQHISNVVMGKVNTSISIHRLPLREGVRVTKRFRHRKLTSGRAIFEYRGEAHGLRPFTLQTVGIGFFLPMFQCNRHWINHSYEAQAIVDLLSLARKECVQWILGYQEDQVDWAGIISPMHYGVQVLLLRYTPCKTSVCILLLKR